MQDIKKGEEICISYVGFDDFKHVNNQEKVRKILRTYWGIACDPSCSCFDMAFYEKVKQGRQLNDALTRLASDEQNRTEAWAAVKKCLKKEKKLDLTLINVKRTIEEGFQITVKNINSTELVAQFMNEACEMAKQDDIIPGDMPTGNVQKGCVFSAYRIRVSYRRTDI